MTYTEAHPVIVSLLGTPDWMNGISYLAIGIILVLFIVIWVFKVIAGSIPPIISSDKMDNTTNSTKGLSDSED